jgi:hypothetical protein
MAVERKLLPWALAGVDLGDELLEVGPGPGLTTDILRQQTRRLTCIEIYGDWRGRYRAGLLHFHDTMVPVDPDTFGAPGSRCVFARHPGA